ncbi:MAG: hypothetical protein RL213_1072 [Bacteroidota bacterium]
MRAIGGPSLIFASGNMSSANNHGGLISFLPNDPLNEMGFLHKVWNGHVYPPFLDIKAMAELRSTWDTDENDVFICTHQKSGTHLTKKFVCEILRTSVDYPSSNGISTGDIGHHTIPWPEVMASQYGMEHFRRFLDATKGYPRVWYMHSAWYDLPFRSVHPESKFIHVFRDPRGAAVSQYFFYKSHPMLGVSDGLTMDFFVDLFTQGGLYFGDYHVHTLDWINECRGKIPAEQLLVLRYEDLVERKADVTRRLHGFLIGDGALVPEQLSAITAATGFDAMKKEMTVNPQSFHFNPQKFFRAGKTDDWNDKLTEDQIDRINKKSEKVWGPGHLESPDLSGVNTL